MSVREERHLTRELKSDTFLSMKVSLSSSFLMLEFTTRLGSNLI